MAVLSDLGPELGLIRLRARLQFAGDAVGVLPPPVPQPVLAGLHLLAVRTALLLVPTGGAFGGAGGAIGRPRHLLTLKLIDDYFPVLKFDDFHACCS